MLDLTTLALTLTSTSQRLYLSSAIITPIHRLIAIRAQQHIEPNDALARLLPLRPRDPEEEVYG